MFVFTLCNGFFLPCAFLLVVITRSILTGLGLCVVGPDLVAGAEIRFLPVIQPLAVMVPAGDIWGENILYSDFDDCLI